MITEERNYNVINTEQAKKITDDYLTAQLESMENITYGLPEIYDRYDIWNVPVLYKKEVIGEVAVDVYAKNINYKSSSDISILQGRKQRIDRGKTCSIHNGYFYAQRKLYIISYSNSYDFI